VAFNWNRQGSQYVDLYLQLIGGGPPLRLTNDGGAHGFPAWSPDGKSIAMLTFHPDRNAGSIAIIPSLGGPERHIPGTEWAGVSRIAWSPDGNWVAASPVSNTANRDRGIVFIPLSGGEPIDLARLNPAFAGSRDPAFSPDGTRLAYVRTRGDFSSEIGIVDLTADKKPGTPRTVSGVREGANPIWTADGTEILFIDGNLTSDGGVSRVRADGHGTPERIGGLGYATSLAISRDGKKLAFSRGGNDQDIWRIDLRGQDPPGQIASSTLFENGAAYSPDGKRIVFSSNRSGAREIWVADANGENALQLTNFGGPVPGTARWSPDGNQIAFDARPEIN
jgi:Tol biopolymer transport system component